MPTKYKYKVVKRKTRMSAIINGNSKYARKYVKGERIFANENTLGIMVFKTKQDAENWNVTSDYNDSIILKVTPIGRGKSVDWISDNVSTDGLDCYYSKSDYKRRNYPPKNTMAYPGVLVVD